jgi:hypothetical protein
MFQSHCGVFWSKRQIDSGIRRKASRRSPARVVAQLFGVAVPMWLAA